jgi:hypothetical protein
MYFSNHIPIYRIYQSAVLLESENSKWINKQQGEDRDVGLRFCFSKVFQRLIKCFEMLVFQPTACSVSTIPGWSILD